MNNLNKEIGHRITMLRYEKKITQAELAEKLDISVKHCSEVERGLSSLSLEKLINICPILSTNLDYLVRGIDKRPHAMHNVPLAFWEVFNSDDEKQKADLIKIINLYFELKNS